MNEQNLSFNSYNTVSRSQCQDMIKGHRTVFASELAIAFPERVGCLGLHSRVFGLSTSISR